MTFSESGWSGLLESIFEHVRELKNPLVLPDYFRKVSEYFSRVPLYPGIIRQSLSRTVRSVSAEEILLPGTRVSGHVDGKPVLGTISSVSETGVVLEDVLVIEQKDSLIVPRSDLELVINENALREEWPGFYKD